MGLDKLYDALETGSLKVEDLASRIRQVRGEIENLENKRGDLNDKLNQNEIKTVDSQIIRPTRLNCVNYFSTGTIMEQRAFLKPLLTRIDYNPPHLTVEYTIPLGNKKGGHF